ncbi:MAG: DUF2817 domain-containing protein [Ilumatobacteraceae bacterium]
MSRRPATAWVALALALVACSDTSSSVGSSAAAGVETSTAAAPTSTSTTVAATTVPPTSTVPPITLAPTTVPSTTLAPTTVPSTAAAARGDRPADFLGEEVVGTSAGGRPITVWHRGTPGGTPVLVIGVIHGTEDAGLAILDRLGEMPLPKGLDLWLMPAVNPDGFALRQRGNANGVDLNRNFPHDWTAIAKPGDWQYSGSGPASEPETKAYIAFAERVRPRLTLWYHQDLFRISPSKGPDGPLRQRYAERTGLKYETISGVGSVYTGVAATWTRKSIPSAMSFVIELGPTLPADQVQVHADAVVEIAQMR